MKITIPGELSSLNPYVRAERGHRLAAAQIKREETDRVAYDAMAAKAKPVPLRWYPVRLSFVWYTADERTDADNVCFAKKFILDGLVQAGILSGDGRKQVAGFNGEDFIVDPDNPRVEVTIHRFSPPVEN